MLLQECSALEAVLAILDELSEVDHQAPWEGAMHVQALKQDLTNLLLDERHAFSSLFEEEQEDLAELVSVAVGVAQLIHDTVQEALSGKVVQLAGKLFDELKVILGSKLFYLFTSDGHVNGMLSVDVCKLRVVESLHDNVEDGSVNSRRVRDLYSSNSLLTQGQLVADGGH